MKKLPQVLISLGILLIASSLILFFLIFAPVAKVEIDYLLNKPKTKIEEIKPVDKNFGIVIPKIGANAKIIKNVNPYNSFDYQLALTKGVAQAKGSAFPEENGNIFLFSHSSQNFFEASKYNSVFYLLHRLERSDKIIIFLNSKKYTYIVTDKKIVDPREVSYLGNDRSKKTLTLMTCWPPGTTLKRLLIIANLSI